MDFKKTFLLFFLWLIVVNIFAIVALNRFNLKGDTAYSWIDPAKALEAQSWDLAGLHARWDSVWYEDIAKQGYSFRGAGEPSNVVFFPLYPFLLSILALSGLSITLLGWILSSVFLFLALWYLFKLVKEFHPGIDASLVALFLLLFPTAFFLNAVYTESLFLFLSVATFYYAFKKNFLLACVFGMLASLTRVTGVLLAIPLAYEYFKGRKFSFPDFRFLSILLVPLGTISFFLFHYLKFGDFFLFFKVEKWWGRAFALNYDHFTAVTHPAVVNLWIDSFFVIFALITTYFVFRRLKTSYGLYMLATVLVSLSTGTFMSIGRYILVLFPIFIWLASVKNT
ncbi:MAG: hypothetical protein PHV93_02920, partial [Candidatus Pacebacteria bacterium]|nr:hypothetical protein [Candidatus Paceibacterota bacterium]